MLLLSWLRRQSQLALMRWLRGMSYKHVNNPVKLSIYSLEFCCSYLGQARLLSASSLERPKPKLEEVRPSTNPISSGHQRHGVSMDRFKEKQQLLLQPLTMQPQTRRAAGSGHSAKHTVVEQKMKSFTKEVG